MRTPRLMAPAHANAGYYHCISRVVDRQMIFNELEKEHFARLMHQYAAFAGIRILAFALMGNHFHLLLEVPRRPDSLPPTSVLFERLALIHSEAHVRDIQRRLALLPQSERPAFLAPYWNRMWNLSQYLKDLKQRFSAWYNRRQGRHGTLWEERFKSILIGQDGPCLSAVAAYIDLNPVRAGVVADPRDYRWSSYAGAMAGVESAQEGYRRLMQVSEGRDGTALEALEAYRVLLYGRGEQRGVNAPGQAPVVRRGVERERVREVLEGKGRLSLEEVVMCRVRYFADGAAIGSRAFVEEVFEENRKWFGRKRRDGAREMKHVEGGKLFSLRSLRANPIG